MDNMTMGQRIAAERKKLGISQEQLGEKTGVSRQAISKWEADGAVPEIDKLIALSRLFSVSVGWLLGVEEKPEQQTDELTESQLKMVEEIVKRYQPKPSKGRLLAITLVGLVGIAAVCFSSVIANPPATDYSSQIDALHQENLIIQSRLENIYDQLETISAGLANYELKLVGVSPEYSDLFVPTTPDIPLGTVTIQGANNADFALLSFGAVPQNRNENEQVFLGVFFDNRMVSQIPLEWMDGVYHAVFSLPLGDGYEYCFIRKQDGIEQWYDLHQTGCSNLTLPVSSTP